MWSSSEKSAGQGPRLAGHVVAADNLADPRSNGRFRVVLVRVDVVLPDSLRRSALAHLGPIEEELFPQPGALPAASAAARGPWPPVNSTEASGVQPMARPGGRRAGSHVEASVKPTAPLGSSLAGGKDAAGHRRGRSNPHDGLAQHPHPSFGI